MKEVGINFKPAKIANKNCSYYEISHEALLVIANKFNWMHELDGEITNTDEQHVSVFTENAKDEEIIRLNTENEILKKENEIMKSTRHDLITDYSMSDSD